MEGAAATVPLASFFQRLAHAAGARAARPCADGTLVLAFGDGGRVVWTADVPAGARRLDHVPGAFFADRLPAAEFDRALDGVHAALRNPDDLSIAGLNPLVPGGEAEGAWVLDARLAERHLRRCLLPGRSAWGPLVFLGSWERGADAVRLGFAGGGRRVELEVRPADAGPDGAAPAFPVGVAVAMDDRSADERRAIAWRVEDYVGFALRRSLRPGTPIRVDRVQPAPGEPPSPDADPGDGRDECDPDAFFIPTGQRQVGHFEVFATVFDSDDAVALATYSRTECSHKFPLVTFTGYVGSMWHRFTPLPLAVPPDRSAYVAPDATQVVLGSEDLVREQVAPLVGDLRRRILVVNDSCLSDLTGVDLAGVVRELNGRRGMPLVFTRAAAERGSSIGDFWRDMLALARPDVAPVPGTVNIVGLAAEDSPVAAELRADLGRVGVRVNGFLVPSFRTAAAESFLGAAATLVGRDALVTMEFGLARERFPGMRFVDVDPPFGPAATRAFLSEAAAAAGGRADPAALDAAWEPHREEWASRTRRVPGCTAAIPVRPGDAVHLLEPRLLYGLPLVAALREMGFAVRVLCLPGAHPGDREWTVARLARVPGWDRDPGVAIEAVDVVDPGLAGLGPRTLVFSEHDADGRVLAHGHLPFGPRDFEFGFGGAVRTAARLASRAACGLFGRPEAR